MFQHHANEKNAVELNLSQAKERVLELIGNVERLEERLSEKEREVENLQEKEQNEQNEMDLLRSEIEKKDSEIASMQDSTGKLNKVSRELESTKTTINDLQQRLDVVNEREMSRENELIQRSENVDSNKDENREERIAELEKERLQLRKKLATVKKASVEIGKQHKQLQASLAQKEREVAQISSEKHNIKVELEKSFEDLRNEKDSMETEFEDTVKELKEITKEHQELTKESNNLKARVQNLESEKEWNLSELENMRIELDEKTHEYLELTKKLEAIKQSFDDAMKKRLDEVSMEKDLEKADMEEEFAKQVNEVCAQKDKVISELKNKMEEVSTEVEDLKQRLRNKDEMISQLEESISSELSSGRMQEVLLEDLRRELEVKDNHIKRLTSQGNEGNIDSEPEKVLSVDTDQLDDEQLNETKVQELLAEIQNLKDEVQILGDGRDALDKRLHEVLAEKQKLYEQVQVVSQERDELKDTGGSGGQLKDTGGSVDQLKDTEASEVKKDFDDIVQEKDKKIAALKRKLKELRREKVALEEKVKIEEPKIVEVVPQIVSEVFQKSEMSSVEALPDNDLQNDKEEIEHLRHERNVYEESYIRIQRDLDQTQKENESLHADAKSLQDIIDGFGSQLEQERNDVKNELEVEMKEMNKRNDEREKELVEKHLQQRSEMESLIEELKEEKLRVSVEIVQLREEISALVNDKEELGRESSKARHTLESVSQQMETAQNELAMIKEKCQVLEDDNCRLKADVDLNKKGKLKLKQKLKESSKENELERSALLQEIQDIKTEKAETCNALRTEFGTALDSRDDLVHSLREKLEVLKTEKREFDEKYEAENQELKLSAKEKDEGNLKLESEVAKLKVSLENVGAELTKVRHEKDNIGDSIRAEFDHICSGLRSDLERVLKERDEMARAMEVGRLGLEKELIDKEETFDGLLQIVKEKDEILNSENVATLKAEVERLRRELSTGHVTLEQARGLVEHKNVVIQTLEEDKKRLLDAKNEVLERTEQELAQVRSSKDVIIGNVEHELTKQVQDHDRLKEKYEEMSREFREINEHIITCAPNQDPSFLEVLNSETLTLGDMRMRSNNIVSQLLENWTETSRRLEKQSRDWESAEESYKLEIEKLESEKEEKYKEVENEWQGKMAEKEEEVEALVTKLDNNMKEIDRLKVEMQKVAETLENEKNVLVVDNEGLSEKLNEAGLKLAEKEQELVALKQQVEKSSHDVEEFTEMNRKYSGSNEKLKVNIDEAKKEIERLQLDIEVLQNERDHFEQRLIENTKHSNEHFWKLFEILRNGQPVEMESTERVKGRLPEMMLDLVGQVQENEKIQESMREEKARVCNEIREEFEGALIERENILEELRIRLRKTHQEYDDVKQKNENQRLQIENLERDISTLRSQLGTTNAATMEEKPRHSGVDQMRTPVVVEEDVVHSRIVEEVMTATSQDSLMADRTEESVSNENLKEQLESLQVLYSERNLQTAQLGEDVIRLRGENETLKDLVQEASLKHSQILEETNTIHNREIEQLRVDNESLRSERESTQKRIEPNISELSAKEHQDFEVNSIKEQLTEFATEVTKLKSELGEATEERAAYEKLRRDFDHIVSGLRGDLERVMSDRENTARMLDNLRSQVHERDVKGSTDVHKDKSVQGGTKDGKEGRSLKEVKKELESVKHHLHEMSLVNRQLKELGSSLDAELKESRRDKQHTEKKCQDLRDEMESFVKEKEAIIIQSRERVETSEKLHQQKLHDVQRQYEQDLHEARNTEGSRQEYKELSSANEELQMKLNDAYEEINNIVQLEETNVALKEEIEVLRSKNEVLTEKVEELRDLVDDADKQIELRDGKISQLNRNIHDLNEERARKKAETETLDDVARTYNDVIQYSPEVGPTIWREQEGRELIKAVSTLELEQKPGYDNVANDVMEEMTSESEKLERELIQTSGHVMETENQNKFLKEELEREGRERKIVVEQLEKQGQEFEKVKKISTKLKNMLKNSRSEVESLNKSLETTKEEILEKEHIMTTLRNEMAELVHEKDEIVRKLMSKIKTLEEQRDETLSNLKSEYEETIKKRDSYVEKVNNDLNGSLSRGDELKAQLDMWRRSYNEVSERANQLENEAGDLGHSLRVCMEEHNKTKEMSSLELSQAQEKIQELNEKLRTATEQMNNSERRNSQVEVDLAHVKEDLDKTIAEKDSIIENLHTEVNATAERLQNLNDELQSKKSLCDDFLDKIEEDEIKFKNLENEMNASLGEKDNIIRQLEDDLGNANESLHNTSHELQAKAVEFQTLLTERDILAEQLNESQNDSQNTSIVKEGIIAETGRNLLAANTRTEELSVQLSETLNLLDSERKRKEELDEISSTLRKDFELRTEQKRELEDVVMALNIDLEKALKDREELRQALRVKQTVTQGTDNPCFDEILLEEKSKEMRVVEKKLNDLENEVVSINGQLLTAQSSNRNLQDELQAAHVNAQDSVARAQSEKKRLEDVIDGLKHDLQQSSVTKEEAINVLRTKLEEAVEERGGAVVSLRKEYDKMLSEKDDILASLQDEIQRVNEEFTNLGYRFELTLQDNVSKGNNIMQLQNQVLEKQRVLDENTTLQQRLEVTTERITQLEHEIHGLNEDKSKRDSEKLELQTSQRSIEELEKRLAANMKENEVSKAKQKKEFKRLYEGLQFDLENSRKQNLEKEKSLQNLREELEEIMKQKEALAVKIRTPNKDRNVERLQKSGKEDLLERLREEKKELLRDLDKTRQEKDEIFSKFHNISEGLRRDLEAAINSRDETARECLKANVMLDKLERVNVEFEREVRDKEAMISLLNSSLEAKNEESSSVVERLRSENENLKSSVAQESMNFREQILKNRNTNEELRQSLAKAEYDRENLRNYVASKEVQNEELKRQLVKEIAERKRVAQRGEVEEQITSRSEEEVLNQTRTDMDETDTMFNASINDAPRAGDERLNKLLARLADAARIQEETNLQLSELEESLQEEKSRREELEILLEEQYQGRDHRVNILDEETVPLTGSPAVHGGQFYQHRAAHINRRSQASLLSLRGCLQSSGLLARLLCGQARGRWPIMLYLLFLHTVLIVCLYSLYSA